MALNLSIEREYLNRFSLRDFMKVDLILTNASELLTLKEGVRIGEKMRDLGIVKNGACAISGGRIIGVGKTEKILKNFSGEIFDVKDRVVMPGFVDSHTHLIFDGTREKEFEMKIQGKTYMEIMEAGGGIYYTVGKTRKASKEKLKKNALETLNKMLLHGTTTVEAKSGYGLDLENEVKSLEVIQELKHPIDIVPTYLVHAKPKEIEDYTDFVVEEILPVVKERNLAEFVDVFCERDVFSVEESRKILKRAREIGFKLKIHADEFSQGGAELAAELACVSADHLLKTSRNGIEKLAEKGVVATLLPQTPFVLNTEYPNARYMIERVPVALATDFNPNCMSESMQLTIALACLKMKMLPQEAISASTVNASKALDKKNIGSLRVGNLADLIVLDIPNFRHLGYHFGVNLVSHVVKRGEIVVKDGRLTEPKSF